MGVRIISPRRAGPTLAIALPVAALVLLAALASCANRQRGGPAPPSTTTSSTTTPGAPSTSATEPTTFPAIRLTPVLRGLSQPLFLTGAGDGSGRLFVAEKGGRIRTARRGSRVDPQAFLDISNKVSTGGEQGLLGLAFPPDFAAKKRFYVDYTDVNGDTIIARYRVGSNGRAEAGSEQVLMKIPQPFPNHNGGMLAFGPDGFLYVGMGDGGSGGDPFGNAKRPTRLLGKILRLQVESSGTPPARALPAPGNPFARLGGNARFVWDLGLRNPWRFSFDRQTGDLYIGDVGQNSYEEIDFARAGRGGLDFGWNRFEGFHTYPGGALASDFRGTIPPVFEYSHALGDTVTGGYVYRGAKLPTMRGLYLFADFGSGTVWGMRHVAGKWRAEQLLTNAGSIASFGEDDSGELYACDLQRGEVLAIEVR